MNVFKLFRIYDMDNDGYISNGELFQVLKMMVGNNLKDTQLQQIVDKTIIMYDKVRNLLFHTFNIPKIRNIKQIINVQILFIHSKDEKFKSYYEIQLYSFKIKMYFVNFSILFIIT